VAWIRKKVIRTKKSYRYFHVEIQMKCDIFILAENPLVNFTRCFTTSCKSNIKGLLMGKAIIYYSRANKLKYYRNYSSFVEELKILLFHNIVWINMSIKKLEVERNTTNFGVCDRMQGFRSLFSIYSLSKNPPFCQG